VGDEGIIVEPDSFWQKKKKAFDKFNRRARRSCRRAVKSQAMFWLIIMLVFLNTCVLVTYTLKPICKTFFCLPWPCKEGEVTDFLFLFF
jgi:multidrug efflux pump subunit AcrB